MAARPILTLQRYVFGEIIGPMVFVTLTLTGLVWVTQALQRIDLIVAQGQSALTFLWLTALILPSVVAIILPFAFFAAVLYALNRLRGDAELTVMWAAGLGPLALAVPVMAAAAIVAAAVLTLSLYLQPLGLRTMKDEVFDIRSDLAAVLIREGQFSTPSRDLTVYIRRIEPDGIYRGIFVHDSRSADSSTTYLAERGGLVRAEERGLRLVMEAGTLQQRDLRTGDVSMLAFERYVFDLTPFMAQRTTPVREESERYLDELLNPTTDFERARALAYAAEAHNRLSSPLYAFAFGAIALAAMARSQHQRRGYGQVIAIAAVAGLLLRGAGFLAQAAAEGSAAAVLLLYAVPVNGILIGMILLLQERPLGLPLRTGEGRA